jgi:hypothetical protein
MEVLNQPTLFKTDDKLAALDELFSSSASYQSSKNFKDLLSFINRFPGLSPFNAFLIHMQNAGVTLVLSSGKWRKANRTIKRNSRPMVILIPFGPVEFVYDVADTEGDTVPEYLNNPFFTRGKLSASLYQTTIANCIKENILVEEQVMHKGSAGYATTTKDGKYKIVINASYNLAAKYSTLVHELAHIYAGHLGRTKDAWWENRSNFQHDVLEIEAESIAYLVCNRVGLETSSDSYLSTYIKDDQAMPWISLDTILTVSNYIEQVGQKGFKVKKRK